METERPSARSSPARGVALIATAVILGLFIVRNGFEDSVSSADDGAPTTETAGASGEQAPPAGGEATTTTAPPRQPGEVTVMVANTTGIAGAAGDMTGVLANQGYQTAPETDAPPAGDTTQVLFIPGFDREAAAVAAAVQAPAGGVQPMPDPPPIELGPAQVLVLLGPDLAG